jgi:hypothetical protein
VRSYDPFGFQHHLIHKKEAHYKGERVPEEKTFYEEVAQDLVMPMKSCSLGVALAPAAPSSIWRNI